MKNFLLIIGMLLCVYEGFGQPIGYMNVWERAPLHIPNESSTDAPLQGNGDIGMCVGFERGILRYYLTKNDFWRLQSKAEHLSGPRVCGYVDIKGQKLWRCRIHSRAIVGKWWYNMYFATECR